MVSRVIASVLTKKKPNWPIGSQTGSRATLKSCQAGVARMPSNASVLSIRITKKTRSQPLGAGLSSPTPQGRR